MATNAQINLNATDKTGNAFASLNKKVGTISTAAKSMVALFAADKVVGFFKDSLKAASEYDTVAAKSLKGLDNQFKTFQVAIGSAIVGNKDLVSGLTTIAKVAMPIVVAGVTSLVKALVGIGSAISSVYGSFIKPFFEQVARGFTTLLNQLEKLPFFGKYVKSARAGVSEFLTSEFKAAEGIVSTAAKNVKLGAIKDRKPGMKGDRSPLAKRSFGVVQTEDKLVEPVKVDTARVEAQQSYLSERIAQLTEEFAARYNEARDTMVGIVESGSTVLGDALANGFAAAFNGEGIGGVIKAFGKTILAGVGSLFIQLGQTYLAYGGIMKGLVGLLGNPVTAGPAGLAIGAALIAMGSALGAIANGGGKAASRATSASSFTSAGAQRDVANTSSQPATIVIQGGFLDMSDPEQQRRFSAAISDITSRRVLVTNG